MSRFLNRQTFRTAAGAPAVRAEFWDEASGKPDVDYDSVLHAIVNACQSY